MGQIWIGLANPLVVAAPSTFSNTWFPPEQRTMATAMATVGNILGHAVGFILGKYQYVTHHHQMRHKSHTKVLSK